MAKDGCEQSDRFHGVLWGLLMVGMGVTFMVQRSGWRTEHFWVVWGPLWMAAFGVARLVSARSPKDVGSGVMFVGFAGWFYVAANGWMGLDWHNSWPLSFIAIGAGMVARSIASWFMRRGGSDDGIGEVRHDG